MKGKDLIKIIQDNQLEEFEIKGNELKATEILNEFGDWGVYLKHYIIDELVDIGHSDKTATFSIIEL